MFVSFFLVYTFVWFLNIYYTFPTTILRAFRLLSRSYFQLDCVYEQIYDQVKHRSRSHTVKEKVNVASRRRDQGISLKQLAVDKVYKTNRTATGVRTVVRLLKRERSIFAWKWKSTQQFSVQHTLFVGYGDADRIGCSNVEVCS